MNLKKIFAALAMVLFLPLCALAGGYSGNFSDPQGAIFDSLSSDQSFGIAVDTISSGGPFIYVVGSQLNATAGIVIKYDGYGICVASSTISSSGNSASVQGVAVDAQGNVFVTGKVRKIDASWDCFTLKYNKFLSLISTAAFSAYTCNYGNAIALEPSGEVIVAGQSESAINAGDGGWFVLKYSTGMVLLSTATANGVNQTALGVAVNKKNGNIYVTGKTGAPGSQSIATIKYDHNLAFQGNISYSGTGDSVGYAVAIDTYDQVLVTGYTSNGSNRFPLIIQYNSSLTYSQSEFFGTSFGVGRSIAVEPEGKYGIVGSSTNGGGYLVLEYDTNLNLLHNDVIPFSGAADAYAVAFGTGDAVYITGVAQGHIDTIRLFTEGGSSDSTSPDMVTNLSASPQALEGNFAPIRLSWNMTGDNGNTGDFTAGSQYMIQYSTYDLQTKWDFHNSNVIWPAIGLLAGSATSYVLHGLQQDMPYYIVVWLKDAKGNTSLYSNIASTITLDGIAPGTISDLIATPLSGGTSVQLTWHSAGDNANSKVLSPGSWIGVQRSTDIAGPWDFSYATTISTQGVAPGTTVSYRVDSLSPNTTYYFVVWTKDGAGNLSNPSNIAHSSGGDSIAPAAVNDLTAVALTGGTSVQLTWHVTGDDGNANNLSAGSQIGIQWCPSSTGPWDYYSSFAIHISTQGLAPGATVSYRTSALSPNTTYYFKVWTKDGAGNLSGASTNNAWAVTQSGGNDGGGGDTIVLQIRDADGNLGNGIQLLANSRLFDGATFQFTPGQDIASGGQIIVKIPDAWSMPNTFGPANFGFVSVSPKVTSTGANLMLGTTGSFIVVEVSSGPGTPRLSASEVVNIVYNSPWIQWNPQNNIALPVMVRRGTSGSPTLVTPVPLVNVVAGTPANVVYDNCYGIIVRSGVASQSPLRVRLVDNNWNTAVATFNVTVNLNAKSSPDQSYSNLANDNSADFSLGRDVWSSTHTITIPAGSSFAEFYFKTSTTAPYDMVRISNNLSYSTYDLWITIVNQGITNAHIHKGDFSNTTSITLNQNEIAYIDFSMGTSNMNWQVMLSTSTDRSNPIWNSWGYGNPMPGQISWNGFMSYYDSTAGIWRSDLARKGTYYVRIQMGTGGIYDDSLSLVLQRLEITGTVRDSQGNPLSGVQVNYYGPTGGNTVTDANGKYVATGLIAGLYNLDFNKPGYSWTRASNVTAGGTQDVVLTQPLYLFVNAHRLISTSTVNSECWGNIQLISSKASGTPFWGCIHFAVDVSTSDNGMWVSDSSVKRYEIDNSTGLKWDAGKWTMMEVIPGSYTFRSELNGYSVVERPLSISTSTFLSDILFTPRASVMGIIQLAHPSQDAGGTPVSIDAQPENSQTNGSGCGIVVPFNCSSATYVLNGLSAGKYTLRAFAQGFRRGTASITINSGNTFVSGPLITMQETGSIHGVITIIGDTTDPALSRSFSSNPFPMNVNCWSQGTCGGGSTQTYVNKNPVSSSATFTINGLDDGTYWLNSWAPGFELQDKVGGNGVRAIVSGGGGTATLTFKRYSARVKCAFTVPGNDYDHLLMSISGPDISANDIALSDVVCSTGSFGITFDTHTGVMTSPPLATGFFRVQGQYTGTGITKTKPVMTVSGQTSDIVIDLRGQTYAISGTVSLSASNPPKDFTDMGTLVDSCAANSNNINWDAALGISTVTFRVKAVDYTRISQGQGSGANGNGVDADAKSGIINRDGSYNITGLLPGVYQLKIPAQELDGNPNDGKETAIVRKIVSVYGDMNNIDLEVSKGYSIKGQVLLPTGETANRTFNLTVNESSLHNDEYIGSSQVIFSNANSGDYEIKGLSAGNYRITVEDWGYNDSTTGMWVPRQYASASAYVKIESSDKNGQNLQLNKGGKILFSLRDADSKVRITSNNRDLILPSAFQVNGSANPWISGCGFMLNTTMLNDNGSGVFEIPFLPEASYDITFGQSNYAATGLGSGSQATFALKVVSGVKVRNGQSIDMGTIDLRRGLSITGTVIDKNGNPLPNVPIVATPSLSTEWSTQLHAITDANGKYNITGLSTDNPYYDFIACPRAGSHDLGDYFFYGTGGVSFGEKRHPMIKIADNPAVNFVLEEAKGSVLGKVVTSDGGKFKSFEDSNIPTAKILMQLDNTVPLTNPIGDIDVDTAIDGTFSVEALSPGTYHLTVLSGGYRSASRTVVVANDPVDVGTITLEGGAQISGSITGVDGKNPSSNDVNVVAAGNADFSEVVMGTCKTTGDNTVTGYEMNGFRPGVTYNIMFFGNQASEGLIALTDYSVPYSSYVKTDLDLTYKIAEPSVFTRVSRDLNRYTVYFDLSGALRKSLPADELDAISNPNQSIITVSSGDPTHLEYPYMSADRQKIICVYTADPQETGFGLRLHAFAKAINPVTGTEFEIDEQFSYFSGVAAKNRIKVSNFKGGKVTLEGDPSNIEFTPGTFEVSGSTTSLFVDFSRAESVNDLKTAAPSRGAPRLVIPRAAPAYPDKIFTAMKQAQSAGVDVFSSFYDVMLPAGVSRSLKKDATLTLQYSGSVDPSTLNIYYYDETNKVYLLENKGRSVDSDGKTISINVNHASVFVILQSNAAVIQGGAYDGPLFVYNFPNPFDLTKKTVTLTNPTQNQTITGTMFHYGLPSSVSGVVEMKIYNIAGELVRTIDGGSQTGGNHYYVEWDGTNDSGKNVASGVYICHFTVDKKNAKFIKVAVIK